MGLYSERFLKHTGGGTGTYLVPSKHRAVIRSLVLTNSGASSAGVALAVAGSIVWQDVVPAQGARNADMRLVVYAGEAIAAIHPAGSDLRTVISGYLFDDI